MAMSKLVSLPKHLFITIVSVIYNQTFIYRKIVLHQTDNLEDKYKDSCAG